MKSITFCVDKLTPPSTPLHSHNNPTSSSPTSSGRPDSGYFSIYWSDQDDTDIMSRGEPVLRRRHVDKPLDPSNVYDGKLQLPDPNAYLRNIVVRGLLSMFSALSGILWALLYPFAKVYSSLKRLLSKEQPQQQRHQTPTTIHPSIPSAFPDLLSPDGPPFRPTS